MCNNPHDQSVGMWPLSRADEFDYVVLARPQEYTMQYIGDVYNINDKVSPDVVMNNHSVREACLKRLESMRGMDISDRAYTILYRGQVVGHYVYHLSQWLFIK